VFAVAARRCDEVFNPPGCVTLWHLPDYLEEEFDGRWETWLDKASEWTPFFEKLEATEAKDLVLNLRNLVGVSEAEVEALGRLRRSAEGRAVPLPGFFTGTDNDLALLALGFAKGEPGVLAVPYARKDGA